MTDIDLKLDRNRPRMAVGCHPGDVAFEVPIVAGIALNERTRKFQLIVTRNAADA